MRIGIPTQSDGTPIVRVDASISGRRTAVFRLRQAAVSAGLYFAGIFTVGWLLGSVRELVLMPRVGPLPAHAAEAILLVVIVFILARWTSGHLEPLGRGLAGLAAAAVLLMAELIGACFLQGQSPSEFLLPSDARLALIQTALLLWAAAAPIVAGRGEAKDS